MVSGCLAAVAAATFATEVPALIRERLASTNETHGAFVQTKRLPDGTELVSRGTYSIRPGTDFEWRTTEPFATLFRATRTHYTYTNEDERVERPLKDLRGYSRFAAAAEKGDCSAFFKAFDALYKEEQPGEFHVLAKPKDARLRRVLERVEADGSPTNWTLKATFPDRTTFSIRLEDSPRP